MTTTKCPKCDGKMDDARIDYDLSEEKITFHDVPALQCKKCGHITMDAKQAERFFKLLERLRGPPKVMTLHRTLSTDGKSLILRIPKDVANALDLSSKDEVEIWVDGERVIVEKAKV